ncbi:MAG: hypothetical protein OXQ89_14890 [Rhodospirillaceae bacterium]|nr:hypothetical protein [Rhodospirillaceae bacterium]
MKRIETGRYESIVVGGKAARVIVPAPLRPTPDLDLTHLQLRMS